MDNKKINKLVEKKIKTNVITWNCTSDKSKIISNDDIDNILIIDSSFKYNIMNITLKNMTSADGDIIYVCGYIYDKTEQGIVLKINRINKLLIQYYILESNYNTTFEKILIDDNDDILIIGEIYSPQNLSRNIVVKLNNDITQYKTLIYLDNNGNVESI